MNAKPQPRKQKTEARVKATFTVFTELTDLLLQFVLCIPTFMPYCLCMLLFSCDYAAGLFERHRAPFLHDSEAMRSKRNCEVVKASRAV